MSEFKKVQVESSNIQVIKRNQVINTVDNICASIQKEVLSTEEIYEIYNCLYPLTQTGEETTVNCDGIFEYIGLSPVTEFVKDLGVLNQYGYVEVNEKMETKVPGVYGAGDCITKNLRQVITACADGAIAAQEASRYVKSH